MNNWSYCGLPPEKTCSICGKKFCAREDYRYTRGEDSCKKYFCSWKHLREFDNEMENRKHGESYKYKDEILRLLDDGLNPTQVAIQLGINRRIVYYYDRQYGGL